LAAVFTSLMFGCSGSSNPTPTDGRSTESILSMIETGIGDDFIEGWACIDEAGEASVYTFYAKGVVEDLQGLRMGTEYSLRSEVEPFHYAWSAVDESSIRLQSPPLDVQDVWTSVEFSDENSTERLMRAVSGAKGQLYCTLGERRA